MKLLARITAVVACSVLSSSVLDAARQSPASRFPGEDLSPPEHLPERFHAVRDPRALPKSPWTRYYTSDDAGRLIVFYASPLPEGDGAKKLPLIVYVQGSGSQSVFSRVESPSGVRASPSSGQGSVSDAAKGRAVVIVVEKLGVKFLEQPAQPGGAEEGSLTFREEHTLPRWSAAVSAAMRAALTLPGIDATRILVEGHSEGGLVACKVGADHPNVTHVATLAGGGPTQLFDLVALARRGEMCGSGAASGDECAEQLLAQWDLVLAEPDSAEQFFLGHPYKRWTSFLATSPIEELRKTRARVFIGQGTADRATEAAGADALYASLRAVGRDVVYRRVAGDHGFQTPPTGEASAPRTDGWQEMHNAVVEWFLAG